MSNDLLKKIETHLQAVMRDVIGNKTFVFPCPASMVRFGGKEGVPAALVKILAESELSSAEIGDLIRGTYATAKSEYDAIEARITELKAAGWTDVQLVRFNAGAEIGDEDIIWRFLFRPGLDLSTWRFLFEGARCNDIGEDDFSDWLDTLKEDVDYIEV